MGKWEKRIASFVLMLLTSMGAYQTYHTARQPPAPVLYGGGYSPGGGSAPTSSTIATALGFNPYPNAAVVACHTDGVTFTPFLAASNTAVARGTALLAAITAQGSDATINGYILNAATYDLGTTQLIQPAGTFVIGRGCGSFGTLATMAGPTTIYSQGISAAHTLWLPGNNTYLGRVSLLGNVGTNNGQQPWGASSSDAGFTGAVIEDCLISANIDAFYIRGNSNPQITFTARRVLCRSMFDTCNLISNTNATTLIDLIDCELDSHYDGGVLYPASLVHATSRSISAAGANTAGTINARGCKLTYGGCTTVNGALVNGGTGTPAVIFNADNCIMTSSDASGSDLLDANGNGGCTYNVTSGRGSGTNGIYTLNQNSGTNTITGKGNYGICTFNSYGSGTAYTLTATPAAITFGTTSPSITLPAGKWRVYSKINVQNNGATFASSRTVTGQLQDTTNSVSLTNGSDVFITGAITGVTSEAGDLYMEAEYTVGASTVIVPFISVSVIPTAGSIQAVATGSWIKAEYLGPQ